MKPIIKVENLSKQYRLGVIGSGTIREDFHKWMYRLRGKEDPFLRIGETNDRAKKGNSDYVWALRDVDFEVMPGEVMGVIGKNGAGKSTLLKILSRVTGPTRGNIFYDGRIGSLLEVGTGFHPDLTGRENIFLNGAILGMRRDEIKSKLDEIIAFSGCERYIDTPTKRYSSGMTVRLGFAVAAHLDPEILVVDEVLAVGDAEFQKKAIGKMQEVSRNEGRTVLFVSHNMAVMESLCQTGILIENGQLVKKAPVGDIVKSYMQNRAADREIPIAERTDRSGTGQNRVTELLISNELGESEIRSFDQLNLSFVLEKPIPNGASVRLLVGAYEYSNNGLFRIDSGEIKLNNTKGIQKIDVQTSPLNLVGTKIFLNVSLSIDGVMVDYLANAANITIGERIVGDIKLHSRNFATILIESSIKLT